MPLKNTRHEIVACERFQGKSLQEAMEKAGYSPKWARSVGSRLLSTNANILDRILELQKEASSEAVMSVTERKERLTIFGRENIQSDKGVLQRHGNISAIAELSKLGGDYPPAKMELTGQAGGPIEITDTREKLLSVLDAIAKRLESAQKE